LFWSWEITNSKEKKDISKKIPLPLWRRTVFWLALVNLVWRLEDETKNRIHSRQWDNPQPHCYKQEGIFPPVA
jgi:hypothetical protein